MHHLTCGAGRVSRAASFAAFTSTGLRFWNYISRWSDCCDIDRCWSLMHVQEQMTLTVEHVVFTILSVTGLYLRQSAAVDMLRKDVRAKLEFVVHLVCMCA